MNKRLEVDNSPSKVVDIIRCSFCFLLSKEVKKLLRSPAGALICDDCVFECVDILKDHGIKNRTKK